MAFAVICAVLFSLLTVSIIYMNMKDKKRERIEKDLKNKNELLDRISEELNFKNNIINEETPTTKENDYDRTLLSALLKRSNDIRLFPLSIISIQLLLDESYFTKKEMQYLFEIIRKFTKDNHIINEIGQGEYVILMYQTDAIEADDIKINLYHALYEELIQIKSDLRIGAVTIKGEEEENLSIEETFIHLQENIKQSTPHN